MSALWIAASLLIIFLILDRVQNILQRRAEASREEKEAQLDVLKIITKQELFKLESPERVTRWISRLLAMLGYTDIHRNLLHEDDGYDFTCTEKGQKTYVVCSFIKAGGFEEPLNRTDVQKLVGAMVGDRIKKGMIITTGELTDEARRYIETLPVSFKITVLDGEKLMQKLQDLRKAKLKPLLES
ncbi:MAG: restriction endonuclease [Bacillota bacterium]